MFATRIFSRFTIGGRLIAGFAALGTVLAAAVGYTLVTVGGISTTVDRVTGLRAPAAVLSSELLAKVNMSLAMLRGYILTGNPQAKADRARAWPRDLRPQLDRPRGSHLLQRIRAPRH